MDNYFTKNLTEDTEPMTDDDDDYMNIHDDSQILDEFLDGAMADHIDFYDIMVGAVKVGKFKGIDADHLEKVWGIYPANVKNTLDITSQHRIMKCDPKLSRNYGT